MDQIPNEQSSNLNTEPIQQEQNSIETQTSSITQSSSRRLPIILAVLSVIVLILVLVLFLQLKKGVNTNESSSTTTKQTTKTIPPQKNTTPIETSPCTDDTVYQDIKAALQKNPENVCTLNISDQDLSELPPDLLKFKNLVTLGLRKNKFTTIPKGLENLKKLKNLGITSNNISSLPKDTSFLSNLKIIDISENPLSENDISIFKKSLPNTEIRYLKEVPKFIQPKN